MEISIDLECSFYRSIAFSLLSETDVELFRFFFFFKGDLGEKICIFTLYLYIFILVFFVLRRKGNHSFDFYSHG